MKTKYLELNPEKAKAGAAPADGSAAPADPNAVAAAPAAPQRRSIRRRLARLMPDGGYAWRRRLWRGWHEYGPARRTSRALPLQGPTGAGWVIEIKGHHYYNDPKADRRTIGALHVRNTLLRELEHGFVDVPRGPGQPIDRFTMKELGIGFAILAYNPRLKPMPIAESELPTSCRWSGDRRGRVYWSAGGFGAPGGVRCAWRRFGRRARGAGRSPRAKIDPDNPPYFMVQRYDFAVQFAWQEKPLNVRLEARKKKIAEAKAAAEAAAAAGPAAPTADGQPATPHRLHSRASTSRSCTARSTAASRRSGAGVPAQPGQPVAVPPGTVPPGTAPAPTPAPVQAVPEAAPPAAAPAPVAAPVLPDTAP